MKTLIILYHSNIQKIYKKKWINKSIFSLLNQTYSDFNIYELNYGGDNYSVLNEFKIKQNKKFWSEKKKNYATAMNFLLDEACENEYDAVFNVNLDDFYDHTRFAKQINLIENGFDVISSDFCYVKENPKGDDEIIHHMNICKHGDVSFNLEKNHNVIAHPCVCYSKNFIINNRYDDNLTPTEDLNLWKKTCNKFKFNIINEELLFYRRHGNQSSDLI